MLTASLFVLHFDILLCVIHTHISILTAPCLLGFTGISQLNEFCIEKQYFPKGVSWIKQSLG